MVVLKAVRGWWRFAFAFDDRCEPEWEDVVFVSMFCSLDISEVREVIFASFSRRRAFTLSSLKLLSREPLQCELYECWC